MPQTQAAIVTTVDSTSIPDSSGDAQADPSPRRRRGWGILSAGGVVVFMGIVVMSALNDAVPTGVSSGSMSGMSMPVGHGTLASLTIRDIDGRPVRLMGRPGVVVFVNAASCDHCVAAVRVAGRAVRRSPGNPALTVVAAASATSRDELLAFAHSTGLPSAHYVVDDRNGTLASKLGASGLGSAVVYDGQGVIVAHPNASLDLVAAALRSARRR